MGRVIPSNFRLFINLASPFSLRSVRPSVALLIFTVGQFVQRKENLNVCLNRIPLPLSLPAPHRVMIPHRFEPCPISIKVKNKTLMLVYRGVVRSQATNLKLGLESSHCAETWPGPSLFPTKWPFLASIVVSKWDALCSAKGIVISTSLSPLWRQSRRRRLRHRRRRFGNPAISRDRVAFAFLGRTDGEKNLSARFRRLRDRRT